ncbi:30S ribosomal protein S20 [Candidatus Kaiserbacteria bacterium]|nr:30S ribosomal protein S20 [Candidatus Kaiserbacteria bacterium]
MAITASAKKAHKASLKKQVFNVRRKRELRDVMKEIATLISDKKRKEAEALLPKAYKAIDKAAKRGVIKDNTASRKKSRLVAIIKKIG